MGEGGGRGRQRERGWVREVGEGDSERNGREGKCATEREGKVRLHEREKERERETDRQTDRQRQGQTDGQRQGQTERGREREREERERESRQLCAQR